MANRRATNDAVRRSWDEETFAKRAALREALGNTDVKRKIPAQQRVELTARTEAVDFEAGAGSSVVIPDGATKSEAGGYYCKHCDVLLHDSSAWLNHINGKSHQAVMGRAMRVKRSTAAEVRQAFEDALARKNERLAVLGKTPKTLSELLVARKEKEAELKRKQAKEKEEERERLKDNDTRMREELGLPASFS